MRPGGGLVGVVRCGAGGGRSAHPHPQGLASEDRLDRAPAARPAPGPRPGGATGRGVTRREAPPRLDLEREAIERLNRGIALCVDRADNGSRELLEGILTGEEDHADWLESQLELIGQVGHAHYLAQQIHD